MVGRLNLYLSNQSVGFGMDFLIARKVLPSFSSSLAINEFYSNRNEHVLLTVQIRKVSSFSLNNNGLLADGWNERGWPDNNK